MRKGLNDMIREILEALRNAGVEVGDQVASRVEVQIRQQFGGERVYIQSLPKMRKAAQLVQGQRSLGTDARNIQRLSKATGIPARTVRWYLKTK
jgi:hypothetical protein